MLVRCVAPAGQPKKSSLLTLDYVTDAVLSKTDLSGDPYVSPDGRFMVVVDDEGDTLTVHRIGDDG